MIIKRPEGVAIKCDLCECKLLIIAETVRDIRMAARLNGWDECRWGKDHYCDDCAKVIRESDSGLCCVCGIPANCVDAIRLTWEDAPKDQYGLDCKIVVAPEESTTPTIVCRKCIRGIKALPFSEINGACTVQP